VMGECLGEVRGEERGEVCGDLGPPLSAESFLFSSGLLPEEAVRFMGGL